jgi:hypothetical protein
LVEAVGTIDPGIEDDPVAYAHGRYFGSHLHDIGDDLMAQVIPRLTRQGSD